MDPGGSAVKTDTFHHPRSLEKAWRELEFNQIQVLPSDLQYGPRGHGRQQPGTGGA